MLVEVLTVRFCTPEPLVLNHCSCRSWDGLVVPMSVLVLNSGRAPEVPPFVVTSELGGGAFGVALAALDFVAVELDGAAALTLLPARTNALAGNPPSVCASWAFIA